MLLPPSEVSSPMGNTWVPHDVTGKDNLFFLNNLEFQLNTYINNYIQEYDNISRRLAGMGRANTQEEEDKSDTWRQRRQVMAPDLGALQSGYSKFFGSENHRKSQNSKKKKKNTKSPAGEDMPIVLVPQEDETECVANNQFSSFGFLGFVLNIVNAVINVANNINNNDNSNNDNNNNNNNNDQNINQVSITETSDNTNNAMAIAGRRIQRLKMMRSEVQGHLRSIEDYKTRKRRSTSSETSCSDPDMVDEALLTAVALVDMWKEVSFETDPVCMALEFCETSWKLNRYSRLSGMMAEVASVAAANMLRNFQGVNPEYLIHAAEQGAQGTNCTHLYHTCLDSEERT